MTPDEIVELLDLTPHPEGGHYRQTWVADSVGRAAGTAIYYLLAAGERSHWHRIDSAELWHFYAGAPLRLRIGRESRVLGPDLASGARPQIVVPPGAWQSAEPLGDWTLVGCTVSPGFTFETFELAPPGFSPD